MGLIVTKASKNMAKTDDVVKTLDELKAENAAIEAENESTPQVDEDTPEIEAVEEELDDKSKDAESDDDESKETEIEDWQKPDSHESEAEKKFTDGDIGKAKAKIRAKLERKTDENEQLKARISELENKPKSQGELNKPKEEDFYDQDNPQEAFIEALTDYKIKKAEAKRDIEQASEIEISRQKEIQTETEQAVDQHYERAIKLSELSGITAETYQNADLQVRQMVDSIFPGSGDVVTDAFISKLGEGSEKVLYSLGVNSERRAQFKKLLQDDTSGIAAGMYLGELKKDLIAPSKRKTVAPPPATTLKGDAKPVESAGAIQKKYDDAHKKGDFGKAFKLKQKAKDGGADTSTW